MSLRSLEGGRRTEPFSFAGGELLMRGGRPLPPPQAQEGKTGLSLALARFLHDSDGMLQDGIDVEIGRIENVSIRRRRQHRGRPRRPCGS